MCNGKTCIMRIRACMWSVRMKIYFNCMKYEERFIIYDKKHTYTQARTVEVK